MFSSIFAIIEMVLKLLGLWDQFLSWSDSKRLVDSQKNTQDRNTAVDDQKGAKDETTFDNDQSAIVNHKPH